MTDMTAITAAINELNRLIGISDAAYLAHNEQYTKTRTLLDAAEQAGDDVAVARELLLRLIDAEGFKYIIGSMEAHRRASATVMGSTRQAK